MLYPAIQRRRRRNRAPAFASLRVAKRVELETHPVDPELLQKLVAEREDLDVGSRLGGADDLGVELVELAKASLLRALVTEHRPEVVQTFRETRGNRAVHRVFDEDTGLALMQLSEPR